MTDLPPSHPAVELRRQAEEARHRRAVLLTIGGPDAEAERKDLEVTIAIAESRLAEMERNGI